MSRENVLKGCLVESDPATIARARQTKRRALLLAILLQVLLVGLLVLAPLLGAVEKLSRTTISWLPPVPYKGGPKAKEKAQVKQQGARRPPASNHPSGIVAPPGIPRTVADIVDLPEAFDTQADRESGAGGVGDPNGVLDLNAPNERRAVVPKAPEPVKPKGPVHVSEPIQLARLVHRVEPVYPRILVAARLEGKVVLRAVIAKDGTIQSLEVLSGNPLFVQAAREAIAQWRYQPTLLNGEPVEVETVITVIFSLRR